MKKIAFVIYPAEFLCYSKFERKLSRILQNQDFTIHYIEDQNSFISKFCEERSILFQKYQNSNDALQASTHAVFFEDRESYFLIKQTVLDLKIPYRTIVLELTKVVNKDRGNEYDAYIGRGTIWGNPYQMGVDGDRDEVIRKFQYDFENGLLKVSADFDHHINEIRGKAIACHCKPAACHGDIIAAYINALDDGK